MEKEQFSSKAAFHSANFSKASSQFIVAGNLESFSEVTSTQRKTDVLHSTLYAQVMADSKCKRCDVESWYREYVLALTSVGWELDNFEFQQYTPSGIFFKLSKIIESSSASFSQYKAIAELLQQMRLLRLMGHKIQLFHEHTLEQNTANFQVLQLQEDNKTGVTVRFTAYYASMPKSWMDQVTKLNSRLLSYLFTSMPTLLVQLFYGQQEGTLSEEKYVIHREHVLKELTNSHSLSELIVSL